LVRIAPDHFISEERGLSRRMGSPIVRGAYLFGKNLLGLLLVCAGVLMSLPGVPGQGLLTAFVGLLLLDVPGKRGIELAIVRRATILRAINRIRARFDKPPLLTTSARAPAVRSERQGES
jgi:UPF0716 family protein affecting phage T7 exclusion